jgi:hypothetical protein
VVALKRYGYHSQPTYLVLAFSGPLDAASAQATANYTITELGRRGHRISVGSAVYDPTTNTVTLAPAQRLDIHKQYRLTVNGTTASGVRGASGSKLNAANVDSPGSDYVTTLDRKTLSGSSNGLTSAGPVNPAPHGQAVHAVSHAAVDHALASVSLHHHGRRPRH